MLVFFFFCILLKKHECFLCSTVMFFSFFLASVVCGNFFKKNSAGILSYTPLPRHWPTLRRTPPPSLPEPSEPIPEPITNDIKHNSNHNSKHYHNTINHSYKNIVKVAWPPSSEPGPAARSLRRSVRQGLLLPHTPLLIQVNQRI